MRAPAQTSAVPEACARIRDTVSLSSLVSSAVLLKRAGREWKGCCPFHADRSPSFTIYADDRRFHCFGCGVEGDALDFVQRHHGVGLIEAIRMIDGGALPVVERAKVAVERVSFTRTDEAIAIWTAAAPADGTPAHAYLESRRLGGAVPPCLRFARLRYGQRGDLHPVLVALIVGPDDQPCGIQRTYLKPGGLGKLAVDKPKLSLGRVKGGAIRLAPALGEVAVTEGMEDALTIQRGVPMPAWAAAGAGMMPAMILPDHIRSVVIGADADEAGERSAREAGERWARERRAVRIIRPADGHKDFNAELMEGRA